MCCQSNKNASRLLYPLSSSSLLFFAERLNVRVVTPGTTVGMLTADQVKDVRKAQQENSHYLHIPRR